MVLRLLRLLLRRGLLSRLSLRLLLLVVGVLGVVSLLRLHQPLGRLRGHVPRGSTWGLFTPARTSKTHLRVRSRDNSLKPFGLSRVHPVALSYTEEAFLRPVHTQDAQFCQPLQLPGLSTRRLPGPASLSNIPTSTTVPPGGRCSLAEAGARPWPGECLHCYDSALAVPPPLTRRDVFRRGLTKVVFIPEEGLSQEVPSLLRQLPVRHLSTTRLDKARPSTEKAVLDERGRPRGCLHCSPGARLVVQARNSVH